MNRKELMLLKLTESRERIKQEREEALHEDLSSSESTDPKPKPIGWQNLTKLVLKNIDKPEPKLGLLGNCKDFISGIQD